MFKKTLSAALALSMFSASSLVMTTKVMADEAKPLPPNTTIGTINGEKYPLDMLQLFFASRNQGVTDESALASMQNQILDEFVTMVIASQSAEKHKLDQRPDVATLLKLSRMQIMSQAAFEDLMDNVKPTDQEIQDTYKQVIEKINTKEYKVRHILVKDEAKAKNLISQINAQKGKNFDALAKKNSEGPTAKDGGSLGWVKLNTLVQPFAEAVASMKKGEWSKTPVQTQFGWHVIMLEDQRNVEPPKLDAIRDQIVMLVKQQKAGEQIKKLRDEAKVDFNKDLVKITPKEEDKKADEAAKNANDQPAEKK